MAVFAAASARGHALKDTSWHPVAAAYLYGEFVAGFKPIDWDGIAARYTDTGKRFRHQGETPAYRLLGPASQFAGRDLARDIGNAVKARNRTQLRRTSARAVSVAIRHRLDLAAKAYENSREAFREVMESQRLYRAFTGHIQEHDPNAYRRLGTAWLELSSITQSETTGARGQFDKSVAAIEAYLVDNFERRAPPPRRDPWLPPDADIAEQDPLPRLVLNIEERGIDEKDTFMIAYGDMLFDSSEIYGETARRLGITCARCHNRSDINQRFYIPGLSTKPGGVDVDGGFFHARGNDHRFDPLDIPSLRGIRFTAPYGRDGRIASLREFTRNVVVGEFGGPEPSPFMLDAFIAYLNEFDFLPAPYLDRNGKLNDKAAASAKRGEALFHKPFEGMNNQSCASCHIPSANFLDGRRHDIGSAERSSPHARDGAFDTPTLLGIAHTAPYFHHGRLNTLGNVVDWFNGRFALGLSETEKADLTAYLEAVGTGEDPYERFDDENTPFKLAFDELSTFLSTLDTLIPDRDAPHARLLIDTVARDLRADAGGITDLNLAPRVHELADRLDAIGQAINAGDWDRAAALWREYKTTEERYASSMY